MFTPSDIKLDPQCDTGVACDIFDRLVATVSEKDARYDIFCIAYQTVITDDSNETEYNNTKNHASANTPNKEFQHTTNQKRRMKQPVLIFSHTEKRQKRQLNFSQMMFHAGSNMKFCFQNQLEVRYVLGIRI